MCGLAGFIDKSKNKDAIFFSETLKKMAGLLKHRGPDSSGCWYDLAKGFGVSHARLAILDLSDAGSQPMISESGRYVIAFNGEIYNHLALREQINANETTWSWRGHSDTETLLKAFEIWGIAKTIKRVDGMFAIAVWDRLKSELYLVRDRLGEKPLYYGWQNGVFMFASELKALKAHPGFEGVISEDALFAQMQHNYIPGPQSIYKNIYKLEPSSIVLIDVDGRKVKSEKYWCLDAGGANSNNLDDLGSKRQLEALLLGSINQQVISDVQVGAFLSGGVDSSLIAALMQSVSKMPIKTFSIGFQEDKFNEAPYAKAIAKNLGAEHTELYVSAFDALDVIPRIPAVFDEPFSDPSQIPSYLLAKMTRQHVNVALSGDGGDELFGGYSRYEIAYKIWKRIKNIPLAPRQGISQLIELVPVPIWNVIAAPINFKGERFKNPGDKLLKFSSLLAHKNPMEMYLQLISDWRASDQLVMGAASISPYLASSTKKIELHEYRDAMARLDISTYLTDNILVKVDRTAMANSLETRVPILNHRVVDFAMSLPDGMKYRNGVNKWLLRELLYDYLPRRLVDRPKQGFSIPLAQWLRGPLRDWAENLLSDSRLREQGYLNPDLIRKKWLEHLSGRRNWHNHLWSVLMFQAWLEAQ